MQRIEREKTKTFELEEGENISVYKGINFLYVSIFGIILVAFAVLLLMWGETKWTLIIVVFYTLLVIYLVTKSYRRGTYYKSKDQ
jgi:membrane protein implicated in regulation of membrane protease activity